MNGMSKGFAVVLVAALAGLIFLLGASLVVVTRLQKASANYDQRVRLAREHARAALDIAVAELQDKLGKDTSVSFPADVLRANAAGDFKVDVDANLKQPFWTGVDAGNYWLVTQPLSATASASAPKDSTAGYIELLGDGTVGSDLLKVSVPKERIKLKGVDGYDIDDAKTIGNYGYWIGDLGVKASYAWYDQIDKVTHGGYEAIAYDPDGSVTGDEWFDGKARLRQMTVTKPELGAVDTNSGLALPTNPQRIDSFVSDFQFRSDFGGTIDSLKDDQYLIDLEQSEVQYYFHDLTPLSKGLLVDSGAGGWRTDLSRNSNYEIAFRRYSEFWESIDPDCHKFYDRCVLDVEKGDISIVPAITQFNLNYTLYISADDKLKIGLECTVEIWNPFAFSMDLGGQRLLVEVKDLPKLKVDFLNVGGDAISSFTESISFPGDKVCFEIASFEGVSQSLRGGQVVVLSTDGGTIVEDGETLLTMSDGMPARSYILDKAITVPPALDSLELGFVDSFNEVSSYGFSADLYIKEAGPNSAKEIIRIYSLPNDYTLSGNSFFSFSLSEPARFGFSWKVDDLSLFSGDGYHPYYTTLTVNDVKAYDTDSSAVSNTLANFASSVNELLGFVPDAHLSKAIEYDVPYILLPKQEMTQVGEYAPLAASNATGRSSISIGEKKGSETNQNDYFDKYFFSTIPKSPSDWRFGDALPNLNYVPIKGLSSFSSVPAKDLFVHGMFNVHSTSIDAWAAILKGSPVSKHPYWKDIFPAGTYLFMNHPLGGEDVNVLDPVSAPDDDSLEAIRLSLKKNAFALTEAQVDALAGLIVKKIRAYVGGTTTNPFDSLEEFVDSGVLQDAIVDLHKDLDTSLHINPSWVVEGTPGEFRQSTILNLISGIISVRSDTFLVRAYGDAVDPANPGKVWARAYCEAIVQRTHEQYGEIADNRTFEVVAFRWLAPSEI